VSPAPPPRGVTGIFQVLANWSTFEPSAVVRGETMTSGVPGSRPRSIQNRLIEHTSVETASRSARLSVTFSAPTMSSSSYNSTRFR